MTISEEYNQLIEKYYSKTITNKEERRMWEILERWKMEFVRDGGLEKTFIEVFGKENKNN
jgi:hypothetical protein